MVCVSHPTVNVITWEMQTVSHQFPTTWENTAKPFVWGESGKLVTIFSPKYRCFSSIRFSFCCILCHTGNAWVSPSISHSMEKCSKTRPMRKTWDIDSHTSPKLWVLLFHQISMLWYTTSYGSYMGVPTSFP